MEKKIYNGVEIEVDKKDTIIVLLIIIITIILYYNGFFYKFNKVTNDNILEIISSEKLTQEEKIKISNKIKNENFKKYENKSIWYILNN